MKPFHTIRILIIEDDDLLRQSLVDMLELNGFSCLVASDGTEGLLLARTEAPVLILTDINMPGMTGFELLEIFRGDEALRAIPVIVISAKTDRATTRRGMELGAADFISKPFTEDEVLHSIGTRLEKQELLDELDAFGHTVAHDLKNPLATLTGRLDLLAMLLETADKATLRHQLEEASKASMRLADIIDELMVLAGVQRQSVIFRPIDMAAIVAESIDRVEDLLKQKSAKIEKPETWPTALGHAPWVVHVWVNYISNAAKYGGPEPLIKLSAATSPDGDFIRYGVEDNGPGLDDAMKARLFVPFTRISTVRVQGHGLGLSIVRRIVEKIGGKVGVTSVPGTGSYFWFDLPVIKLTNSRAPFSLFEEPVKILH